MKSNHLTFPLFFSLSLSSPPLVKWRKYLTILDYMHIQYAPPPERASYSMEMRGHCISSSMPGRQTLSVIHPATIASNRECVHIFRADRTPFRCTPSIEIQFTTLPYYSHSSSACGAWHQLQQRARTARANKTEKEIWKCGHTSIRVNSEGVFVFALRFYAKHWHIKFVHSQKHTQKEKVSYAVFFFESLTGFSHTLLKRVWRVLVALSHSQRVCNKVDVLSPARAMEENTKSDLETGDNPQTLNKKK